MKHGPSGCSVLTSEPATRGRYLSVTFNMGLNGSIDPFGTGDGSICMLCVRTMFIDLN